MQVKRRNGAARESAATNDRNFRTFLLVAQLEAKAIGERLAKARNEAGLTQEQVADLATFSRRSLQDYEAGVTIPYRHMRELSGIYTKPVEWFLHGDATEGEQHLREEARATLAAVADGVEEVLRRLSRIEVALGIDEERGKGNPA